MDFSKVIGPLNNISSAIFESFNIAGFASNGDLNRQYVKQKSFTDFLPIVEYLADEQVFLLEDLKTFAIGIKFKTINVEGFPEKSKASMRDTLIRALNTNIPMYSENPIVANVYFSNQYNLTSPIERIKAAGAGNKSDLKDCFNAMYEKHLNGIAKEGGIFEDTQVTDLPFSGKTSDGYLFLYRRGNKGNQLQTNLEEILVLRDKLIKSLSDIDGNFDFEIMTGKSFYDWFFPIFNKEPGLNESALLNKYPYAGDEDVPFGRDFSTMLTRKPPVSDVDRGLWYFGGEENGRSSRKKLGRRAKFLTCEAINSAPPIGAFTASQEKGSKFDAMPEGVVFSMTIVFLDQKIIRKDIEKIKKKAVGDSSEARAARYEADVAEDMIVAKNPILPVEIGFYVFGKDERDLLVKEQSVKDAAGSVGLQIMDSEFDIYACDTFLKFLPCNYRWKQNETRQRSIKCTLQHICNYMPILGKGRGTGSVGNIQFNRGGEEMFFDIINDYVANAHLTMIGSSGAGKSAKLVEMFFSYLAIHNPRFYIIEKGDSFKRAVEFVKNYGITVNSLKLNNNGKVAIPPFANAYKALDQELSEREIEEPTETYEQISADLDSLNKKLDAGDVVDDEVKDYLGEMEILAKIMATGGDSDKAKEYGVVEASLIRKAIMKAAKECREQGKKHPLVEDVAKALRTLDTEGLREKHKDKLSDMALGLDCFCSGLAGNLFNREGTLWEEADVTHIDLGDVTRDGKHAELAISYASILNSINDIAERDQNLGRPIIVLTDEAHNVVSKSSKASPILVPAIVKIVKMWRKLNAWNWMATQNIKDYCAEAEAILKLNEWLIALAVEKGEDEDIASLKKLTDEEKALMSSVTKEDYKFTEGFVSCRNKRLNNQLFRNIPPSLILVMGWSDGKEKKIISDKMEELNCSEQVAILHLAAEIDNSRGIAE
ncbi:conjugative transfer ATPase [Pseudoalteromonas luteoviolacea]|uniref:conjugative transfer ATPase n=1 Tax=Pseudoalteromonas luteoviolacea TaxID=43657 RepID=UPI0007B0A6B2|nr:conjugative transfer ATPase [Pseudoalteromonas luteoviolacea]